jgi:MFS family permease
VPFCVGPAGLAAWLFALGACCSALYPLGLALLGERVPPGSLAQANAWYLASNCAGSLSGPVLIGLVIDLFGPRAQFAAAAAAVLLVLGPVIGGCGLRVADSSDNPQPDRRSRPGEQPCRMAG